MTPEDYTLLMIIQKLFLLVAGPVFMWLVLRTLDKLSGFEFKKWLKECNDVSKSLYFSARFVGCLVYAGLVLS